jgi:ATP-binding cassette subfamily F protein 3
MVSNCLQLPDLQPPEQEETEQFKYIRILISNIKDNCSLGLARFPETDKISPPLLQANDVTFGYSPEKIILRHVNFDVGLDSRIAMVGANGAGKSTL